MLEVLKTEQGCIELLEELRWKNRYAVLPFDKTSKTVHSCQNNTVLNTTKNPH